MRKNLRYLLTAFVLLVSVLLIQACGDSEDSDDGDSDTQTGNVAEPTAEPTELPRPSTGEQPTPTTEVITVTRGLSEGNQAPAFTLPAASGGQVSLSDYNGQAVLLFFHMAVGWPPCMEQIVDLQNDRQFQALDVEIVSIALDPASQQAPEADRLGINAPMLVDADASVSERYDVMQWAVGTGEPGHTFILVDEQGEVVWIRDYGAPENGGLMYVPIDELNAQMAAALNR